MAARNPVRLIIAVMLLGLPACHYEGPRDDRFNRVSAALDYSAEDRQELPVSESVTNPNPVSGAIGLDELVELGLKENPEIEQARLLVESLGYRIRQASSLPDPQLGTTAYLSPVQTAAGQQEFGLSVSQKVIRRNKRETQAAIAQDELDAARAALKSVEDKVVEQIASTYFELGFLQEVLQILEADRKELELVDSVVDRRFRVLKNVSQQDTLQIQVAVSRLETEIEQYRRLHRTLQARLARLTHSPPGRTFIVTTPPPPGELVADLDELIEKATRNNPDLHAQLFEIRRHRDTAILADLGHQPDYTLGMNWISTATNGISPVANGDDAFMLTLGMNLPVYRERIDSGIREAQIRALAQTKKYESLKDEKAESITEQVVSFMTVHRNLKLFQEDILPKQKLTWEQSIRNYEVGQTDFLQMIDNWRKLLQFQIQEQRMVADLHKSLAVIDRILGESLHVTVPLDSRGN